MLKLPLLLHNTLQFSLFDKCIQGRKSTVSRFHLVLCVKNTVLRLAFADKNNNGRIEIEDDPGTPEDDTEVMRLSRTPCGEIPHAG
jgi:hypothetical protein